jgi:hypothetical protein
MTSEGSGSTRFPTFLIILQCGIAMISCGIALISDVDSFHIRLRTPARLTL